MKKILLLSLQLLLISAIQVSAQTTITTVVVNDPATLKTTVENATEDLEIQLSGSFPTVLSDQISLSVSHGHTIIINGLQGINSQIELTPATNKKHFSVTPTSGPITFKNIVFKGFNTGSGTSITTGGEGGGVSIEAGSGNITFDNTHFTCINGHGAINGSASNNVNVINSTFDYNYSGTSGGALRFEAGVVTLTVDHCSFNVNTSNAAGWSGGAIGVKVNGTGAKTTITNSVFLNNSTVHLGGAIAFHNVQSPVATVNIDNCYFEGNKTKDPVSGGHRPWADGGAIGFHSDAGNHLFTLSNSTFVKNEAYDDGGALLLQNGNAGVNRIFNNTFFENTAWSLGDYSTNPRIDPGGGAIQFSKNTLVTLENNTLIRNTSSGKGLPTLESIGGARGGAISFHYDTHPTSKHYPTANMKNNILLGNIVTDVEGKVIENSPYANITLSKLWDGTSVGTLNDLGGNLGIDDGIAIDPLTGATLTKVFGSNTPALFTNATLIAKVGDPKGNSTYYRINPTFPILPGDDLTGQATGLADNYGTALTPTLATDQRGYPRDATKPDAGATEIFWVRFNANGGSWTKTNTYDIKSHEFFQRDGSNKATQHYAIVHYTNGVATLTVPSNPDPAIGSGLSFDGWVSDDGLNTPWTLAGLIANQNTKVKAKWITGSSTYQVIYNGNGADAASVPTNDTGITGSSPYTVKPGTPVKTNSTFLGWQAAGSPDSPTGTPSLSGGLYAAGDNFTMPNNDVTLTAQWKDNTPPVDPPKPPVPPVDPEDPEEPDPDPDLAITVGDIADFCYFDREFRIPFILHYTKEELKYTILFSQEAKDAGFTDITDQKVLSGSYITVPVSAAIPAGVYQGTIKIHASANANIYTSYTFTIRVMDIVRITKQPVSVTNKCEGDGLVLSVTATGANLTYQWFLEGQRIEGATNDTYSTVLSRGKEGFYHVEVYGDCGYEVSDSANVRISGLSILMKWDDVMYVSNVDNKYKRFQWYLNGEAITTHGTSIYYTNPEGLQGTYFVRAYKADDSYDESCSLTFTEGTRAATVSIYPNPVQQYTYLNIESPEAGESFIGSKVDVYDMAGRKVYSTTATSQKIQIPANMALGVHIVHITMKNGKVISQKVVVK